jgi:hypothetical protein
VSTESAAMAARASLAITRRKPTVLCGSIGCWPDRTTSRMSALVMYWPVSGPAEDLKSFGRRRRTKVVDERTRGTQAPGYGDFECQSTLGVVCPRRRQVWRAASVPDWCAVRRFCAPRFVLRRSVGPQLGTPGTSLAFGRSSIAAAQAWLSAWRVTKGASRSNSVDAAAPWADSSG